MVAPPSPATAIASGVTRRSVIQLIVGLVAAGIAIYVVAQVAGGMPPALDALADASLPWLAAAVAAEAACYIFIGVALGQLLARPLGPFVPVRIGLLLYGLGSLLPGSPAPGLVMATVALTRRGLETGRAALVLFWCTWFNLRSFLVLGVLTATSAVVRGRVPDNLTGFVVSGALFVVAALFLTTAVVSEPGLALRLGGLIERLNWHGAGIGARAAAGRIHETAMNMVASRRRRTLAAVAAFLSWAADVVCLRLALIAVDVHLSMGVVLIAYVAAMGLSSFPLLPGGLGVVEATVPAVLHHYGVPVETALAGTLAWRAIALICPAVAGLVALGTLQFPRLGAPQPVVQPSPDAPG